MSVGYACGLAARLILMKNKPWPDDLALALRVNFHYDPITGFVSRRMPTKRAPAGPLTARTITGGFQTNFTWRGKLYNLHAHRLAYFLHTGLQPMEVWHRDGNKANNIFTNLIPVESTTLNTQLAIDRGEASVPVAQLAAPNLLPVNIPVVLPPIANVLAVQPDIDMVRWGSSLLIPEHGITISPIGGLFFKGNEEFLPLGYNYRKQCREEQLRVRRGWMIWKYFKKPDAFGVIEAEQDAEMKIPLRYIKEEGIRAQNAKDGGPRPWDANLSPEQVEQEEGPLPANLQFVLCGTYPYVK